jgi:hypothetical protein
MRMGATRRNLRAQPKILKKNSELQVNQSKRKFSQKKYVYYLKSVKEPKIRMRATGRNSPGSLKNNRTQLSSENLNLKRGSILG